MNKKLFFISEVILIFSLITFIYLFFTDKVFKFMVLDIRIIQLILALIILTVLFALIPILFLFVIYIGLKIYFYRKEKNKALIIFNYTLSSLIFLFCIYGVLLQSDTEKIIKLYKTEENLIEILEKRLVERNTDFNIEFLNAKVTEGNDSSAKTTFNIKVNAKNEEGYEKLKKYDYMYDGRQLEIIINCYQDKKCYLVDKPNGPIRY